MTIEKGIEQLARNMIHDGEGTIDIYPMPDGYIITFRLEIKNAQPAVTD